MWRRVVWSQAREQQSSLSPLWVPYNLSSRVFLTRFLRNRYCGTPYLFRSRDQCSYPRHPFHSIEKANKKLYKRLKEAKKCQINLTTNPDGQNSNTAWYVQLYSGWVQLTSIRSWTLEHFARPGAWMQCLEKMPWILHPRPYTPSYVRQKRNSVI
jgi:hypothetical protein